MTKSSGRRPSAFWVVASGAPIFVDSTRVESRSAPVEAEIDQGAPELRPHKTDVVEGKG